MEKAAGVARIYLSNPQRYNAMSLSMWRELARLTLDAENDPDVRVLLLQGAGDKAFVSGADISEFKQVRDNPEQVAQYGAAVHDAQYALSSSNKPVIAGIHGVCMGGGIGLALSCDLRYCADNTRFRMPAARLGLGYDLVGMRHTISVIGAAATADMFFTARIFDGREAERVGMVHKSFAAADLPAELDKMAAEVALNAPLTMRAAKLALRYTMGDPKVQDEHIVHGAIQACFDSEDYKEGQKAFREKRPPRFRGQ
jgi:enoyl-CoA hydratase/carnithine racemase